MPQLFSHNYFSDGVLCLCPWLQSFHLCFPWSGCPIVGLFVEMCVLTFLPTLASNHSSVLYLLNSWNFRHVPPYPAPKYVHFKVHNKFYFLTGLR
jgi:hypothetical protein